jgi:outer membrane protein assembly factor BamB
MGLRLLLALLIPLVGGCGTLSSALFGSEDNIEAPRKLEPIDESLAVSTLWSRRAGDGAGNKQDLELVPAYLDGRVFIADRKGRVFALDAATGEELWRTNTKISLTGGVGAGAGLVLVGSAGGELVALDAADGSERWRTQLSSEVLAPPRARGGTVVARAVDGVLVGLDADTGHQRWLYTRRVPSLTLRGTSAPALAAGRVVSGFDNGKLTVLSLAEGTPLWERSVATATGRSELERMVDIDADPVVEEGVIYVVAYQGRAGAVDLASGRVLWAHDVSSYAGLDVGRSHVMVTDAMGEVWALDRRTGNPLWKQDGLRARFVTGPGIVGDYAAVGDFEGYLHWLSLETGRFVARQRLDSAGINVPPLVVDRVAYVLGRGGKLTALTIQ